MGKVGTGSRVTISDAGAGKFRGPTTVMMDIHKGPALESESRALAKVCVRHCIFPRMYQAEH